MTLAMSFPLGLLIFPRLGIKTLEIGEVNGINQSPECPPVWGIHGPQEGFCVCVSVDERSTGRRSGKRLGRAVGGSDIAHGGGVFLS